MATQGPGCHGRSASLTRTPFRPRGRDGGREARALHPTKHRLGERPPVELAKARIRLVIASVFSNLNRQMRLQDHLAKTLPGLVQRIAQRLVALTLGMFLNLLTGGPARALVAYDGR